MKSSIDINEYHLHQKAPSRRQFELFNLNEYLLLNKEHSSKPHSHSFYQIVWFHSNNGKHHVDFKSYDIKKDRIFFIAKNQIHYFEKRNDYQGVLLHFNESFILQNEKDIEIFINYDLFNNPEAPFFDVFPKQTSELEIYYDQIKNELKNVHTFGHQSILTNILKSFLITIEREKRKHQKTDSSPEISFSMLNFRKLLEKNYRNNYSVSDYAKELSISTKTLNNIIKSATGKTVSKIINERIILEAKRQLFHTCSFVNEIGYDLGFQDHSYFVKFFKKQVNITPSEFRKSIS